MPSRWKTDRPMSRAAFEARFPDEAACGRHLVERRWPNGFVCPHCGNRKAGSCGGHGRPFNAPAAASRPR